MRAKRIAFNAIVSNLRHRWPEALAAWSDSALYRLYDDFSVSDDFGDDDAKLPEWFELLPHYQDAEPVQLVD